jgi:hypothetical protein
MPVVLRYQCGLLAPNGAVPDVAAFPVSPKSSIAGTILGFSTTRALAGFMFI